MRKFKVQHFDKRTTPQPVINPDQIQDIDYEICWCIEKLENIALKSGSEKEREQCEASLKVLRNPETAFIKKRQVMRQHFGDYKKAMANDKKNFKNDINVKFREIDSPVKSVFIRHKSALKKSDEICNECPDKNTESVDSKVCERQSQTMLPGISLSNNSFRFNF